MYLIELKKIPCGAALIGQVYHATLKKKKLNPSSSSTDAEQQDSDDNDNKDDNNENFDVVIKVQYPQASWQVPADIKCIGQFL